MCVVFLSCTIVRNVCMSPNFVVSVVEVLLVACVLRFSVVSAGVACACVMFNVSVVVGRCVCVCCWFCIC